MTCRRLFNPGVLLGTDCRRYCGNYRQKNTTGGLTRLESTRGLVVYDGGAALNPRGTRYSSASVKSFRSSSSRRLWKNLLSFGLGSFMRSSPWKSHGPRK
ncbi:hypothetical protein EYF80_043530 [Liparis tanakae]|uniref:Uncharacterized protein n=1 Tax=Liparis tanakae TaxID=230148 RepID=A0A4Z2G192_9TELE|nr:hypothetical protein EYF80_043530 [Liparis tanakae]